MHTSTTSTSRLDPWTEQQLQAATQGQWWHNHRPQQPIARILSDSRAAQAGDAFLALKGERFDGHDFVSQVAAQGASCVIVQRPIEGITLPQLIVDDTRLALGRLGAYRRAQCPQLTVAALTGSSGKTTTKEMLGSILARLGETLLTRGNLNNDLGVPMMLLELRQDHRYAVIELGASHRGEIDYTASLVQPDVAGILNIGSAHLGEFGGRQGIFEAKSEIYAHLHPQGQALIPAADAFAKPIQAVVAGRSSISFGQGGQVYATNLLLETQSASFDLCTPRGKIHIQLPFAGLHNVHNAEAAAAFALAMGVELPEIAAGLAAAKAAQGRLNFLRKEQYLLIDDTYNANPHSMRAAAEVLAQQAGIKVMVMGDIGELGETASAEHTALGQDLTQKSLDYLIAVGEYAPAVAQGANSDICHAYANQHDALQALLQLVHKHQPQPMTFLFKGSRYTHSEKLLAALMERL
jgi:UDP-N-acetylmuramoyl-tripeptide--D-alanyl-D-alanine ligase